jgi:hypothetical protein
VVKDKAYLVVMVVYLDSPLVTQNILKVLEVLVGLILLLLDLMLVNKNLVHLYGHLCMHTHKVYSPSNLWFGRHTNNNIWVGVVNGASITITIEWGIAT